MEESCKEIVLTATQVRVVALSGVCDKESDIAKRLCVSPHTVHSHLKTIERQLRVKSRAAALGKAVRLGIVTAQMLEHAAAENYPY